MFANKGNLNFEDVSKKWGFSDKTFSNGAAYGDLDNDGDLDLIINNVNQEALFYKNNTSDSSKTYVGFQLVGNQQNTYSIGSTVQVFAGNEVFQKELIPSRGFQSSVDYKLMMGLPKGANIDSVMVTWFDRTQTKLKDVGLNKVNVIDFATSKKTKIPTKKNNEKPLLEAVVNVPFSSHVEDALIDFYTERNVHEMLSQEGPKMAIGDVNGDKQDDIYICGGKEQPKGIYLSTKGGFTFSGANDLVRFISFEDTAAHLFDADGDGDLDLFVGSGGNYATVGSREMQDRMFYNDGKGNFTIRAFPSPGMNTAFAISNDYDGDGDLDLFVGARSIPQIYGASPKNYLYQNDGKGVFTNVTATIAKEIENCGMLSAGEWVDIDGDSRKELIVVGEWTEPMIFRYDGAKFTKQNTAAFAGKSGFWYSLAATDIDGDGDKDLVLGNSGENCYLGTRHRFPLKLWVNDFDGNGGIEKILSRNIDGKDMPVFMKRDMNDEIPSLRKKILKHHDYATMTIQDLFEKDKLKKAIKLEANYLKTVVAVNDGKGNFTIVELPIDAQLSSVYSIFVSDLNHDGKPDLVLGGNSTNFQPQFGRMDANYGEVFLNKGNATFEHIRSTKSGIHITGQIRDMKAMTINGKQNLIVGLNNQKPRLYKMN
jgi:hypothetical protein